MNYNYGKKHLYKTWKAMNRRCNNPEDANYKHYGGRGIKVCDEWLDDNPRGLDNFYLDMGDKPHDVTLDRIDNDGDYTKNNCRWATHKDQGNNKRTNHTLIYEGVSIPLGLLAEQKGIVANTLCHRLRKGWSLAEAVGDVARETPEYTGTLTVDQRQRVQELNTLGMNSCEIAREMGLAQWVVYNYYRTLEEPNLDIVGFDGSVIRLPEKVSSVITKLLTMMDLLSKGYTRQVVAKELGVSASTITDWVKMLGVEVRKHPPRKVRGSKNGE